MSDDPSEAALLRELLRIDEMSEGVPTQREVHEHGEYDPIEYTEAFGSWITALVEAGVADFEFPDTAESPSAKYTDKELMTEIWRLTEHFGEPASSRDMDRFGEYSASTYSYRYGSWNEALEAAGLQPREPYTQGRGEPKSLQHYTRAKWKDLRQQALERDGHECQVCGMSESENQDQFGVGLNVHHVTDVAEYDDPSDADVLENLESLCSICHGKEHPFGDE